MHRRRFLAATALSATGLAASAGCLGSRREPVMVHLDELWFVNTADDGCDVSATVTDASDATIYETSFRLGPAPSDQDPVGNVTRDPDLDDPGQYVVTATVGDSTTVVDTTESVETDEDCVIAKFERSSTGAVFSNPLVYNRC